MLIYYSNLVKLFIIQKASLLTIKKLGWIFFTNRQSLVTKIYRLTNWLMKRTYNQLYSNNWLGTKIKSLDWNWIEN